MPLQPLDNLVKIVRMRRIRTGIEWIALTVAAVGAAAVSAQQVVDPDFQPVLDHAEYERESGPVVMVDEAHHNYHTAFGQYEPFARVLRLDGFRVQPFTAKFSARSLRQGDILVIANAVSEATSKNWSAPATSAFSDREIAAV